MPCRAKCSVKCSDVYWATRHRSEDQPIGDRMAVMGSAPGGHPQAGQHQVGVLPAHRMPADDRLGEGIDDEGDVDEPRPGPDVGEVGDEQPVRRRSGEVESWIGACGGWLGGKPVPGGRWGLCRIRCVTGSESPTPNSPGPVPLAARSAWLRLAELVERIGAVPCAADDHPDVWWPDRSQLASPGVPAPIAFDPSGQIARTYHMPVPHDGGPPVGYATLAPGLAGRLREVRTMVGALQ